MIQCPLRATRTDTLFPYTTRFRAEAIHCAEMDDGMATERSSDKKPCDRMTLGCLVAMGCIALMAMPDTAPGEFAVLPVLHAPSVEGNSAGLHNKPAPDRKSTRLNSSH